MDYKRICEYISFSDTKELTIYVNPNEQIRTKFVKALDREHSIIVECTHDYDLSSILMSSGNVVHARVFSGNVPFYFATKIKILFGNRLKLSEIEIYGSHHVRKAERYVCNVDVFLSLSLDSDYIQYCCTLLNISASGLCLDSSQELDCAKICVIRFPSVNCDKAMLIKLERTEQLDNRYLYSFCWVIDSVSVHEDIDYILNKLRNKK